MDSLGAERRGVPALIERGPLPDGAGPVTSVNDWRTRQVSKRQPPRDCDHVITQQVLLLLDQRSLFPGKTAMRRENLTGFRVDPPRAPAPSRSIFELHETASLARALPPRRQRWRLKNER
jgi:hypothetical protein